MTEIGTTRQRSLSGLFILNKRENTEEVQRRDGYGDDRRADIDGNAAGTGHRCNFWLPWRNGIGFV